MVEIVSDNGETYKVVDDIGREVYESESWYDVMDYIEDMYGYYESPEATD